MRWNERVHESLEVWSPPLCQRVSNLPFIINTFSRELTPHRRQPLIQPHLEPLDLVIFRFQIVTRKLEESVCNLQHKDVRMIVFVADQDALAGSAHAMLDVMFL